MKIKQLFCKHYFEKMPGRTRNGGFMLPDGETFGGQIYHHCKCLKCGKEIEVHIPSDEYAKSQEKGK